MAVLHCRLMGSWVKEETHTVTLTCKASKPQTGTTNERASTESMQHCNYFAYLSKIIHMCKLTGLKPEGSVHRYLPLTHTYTVKFFSVLRARMRSVQHFCTMDATMPLNFSRRHRGSVSHMLLTDCSTLAESVRRSERWSYLNYVLFCGM